MLRRPLLLLSILSACHRAPHGLSAVPDAPRAESLPAVRITPDGGPYVFSWYGADGKVRDASGVAGVPSSARKQVLVRDLSRTSAQLQSDRYLYLADLSQPAEDDGWPTSVVSRYSFEAQDDGTLPALGAEDDLGGDGGASERPLVVVYGTSWCGACRAAREHLRERRVAFVDKDIEKDPAAARELERKAKRAGLRLGGVPVLDIGGRLLTGFDANAVDRLLAEVARG